MECSNAGEFIDLLLNSGADPNEKDDTGRTPLHYATRSGHCDTIIKLLLRKGANLDIKDKKGKTPIEFAVNNPNLNIKEYFLTDDVIYGTFRKKHKLTIMEKSICAKV
ncbi:ankyrin repeat domain-containing protein [Wolbachia endosymbiont of Leptopilina clavipes]|uniref:ankyrin repeat domain-containing protein n=1 Tax=Wolbachia endosymbiont of Leptopilina clavipes TaxID=260213 RepID=UPI001FE4A872|nr:ankyrin repeat domain-containing protein [Wolbachia endosymbiont of Leptopilina clavipes]